MKTLFKLITVLLLSCFVWVSCEEEGIVESGTGTLEGTVVSRGDNTPLANVKITTNPSSNTVFTNENGKFLINDISVGDYSVQAELNDFIDAFEAATIVDGQTINVVFELETVNSTNIPPNTPILVFPEDNATEIPRTVDFIWNSAKSDEDEISYTFELRNGTTNEVVISENIVDTTFNVTDLNLDVNYFWQVTASDDVNPPVESSISSFSTKDPNANRFYYVRTIDDNNVIFSGTDQEIEDDITNENEIQLTNISDNSFRPRANQTSGKIAFLRTVGTETHVFSMNPDGTEVDQITNNIPVVGFRQDEVDFTWSRSGSKIFYPNLNKLYSINSNGTGLDLIYEAAPGTLITEIDANEINNLLAIKTNDTDGYNARIVIINPGPGIEVNIVLENVEGAVGGIDFSIDGNRVLYTRDVSGFENPNYRQLDSRVFIYDIINDVTVEIESDKPVGSNDLDVKYAPDEGSIIFVNTSNDGVSVNNIYKVVLDGNPTRELIFTDAAMPDWE